MTAGARRSSPTRGPRPSYLRESMIDHVPRTVAGLRAGRTFALIPELGLPLIRCGMSDVFITGAIISIALFNRFA